jgi:hypothetical protein
MRSNKWKSSFLKIGQSKEKERFFATPAFLVIWKMREKPINNGADDPG